MQGLSRGYIGITEKNMETTILYMDYIGLPRDNGKSHGNYNIIHGLCRGYIGTMENNMGTTILHRDYIGVTGFGVCGSSC